MAHSVRAVALVTMGLFAAFLHAPASAAEAPPEPYRIATGLEGALGADHVVLGDRIFWSTYGNSQTSSQDIEVWTSDGTAAGTKQFFDPNPGGLGRATSLHAMDGGFVFLAEDGVHGQELWYSDGTVPGTEMVADLTEGSAGTWLVAAVGGTAYVAADDGVHGRELYRWSGPGTTPQLLDINTTASTTDIEELEHEWRTEWTDANPGVLGMIGDTLIFTADRTIRTARTDEWGEHYIERSGSGEEVWKVGPTGSPSLVRDITPPDMFDDIGSTSFARWTGTAVMAGSLYFLTEDTDDDPGPELWRTNGFEAGTTRVASLSLAFDTDHWDFEPVVAGGKLFYRAWNGGWDGIWATNGSGAGQRVSPAGDGSSPVALGAGVVFGQDGPDGREPWFSNGTTSIRLADVRAGALGSSPSPFFTWGSATYFGASDGAGRNLYRTDGTTAGTQRVHDLPNQAGAIADGPMKFIGAQNRLYFINSPDGNRNVGLELWAFDPARVTTANTSKTVLTAPTLLKYGAGGKATVTVSGAGGPPTGTATLRDGATVLATAKLVNGRATFVLPKNLRVGSHRLTAVYSGSAKHRSSVSNAVTTIVKAATKLTGRVADLTFTKKEKIRVTARLKTTPNIRARGVLTLYIDGKKRASKKLAAKHKNTRVLVSKPLKPGKHRVQVKFTNSPNAWNAKTGVIKIKVVK